MNSIVVRGKVWKYGDNINTDIISPPQYMELSVAEAAKYTLSALDTEFASKVRKGDILSCRCQLRLQAPAVKHRR